MRSLIYNYILGRLTAKRYCEVLSRINTGSSVLDVGVGTGAALCKNKSIILKKNLHVLGIDINTTYLKACKKEINKYHLQDHVDIKEISFYNLNDGAFDAIYFSSSFMTLPDQQLALQQAKKLLAPQGKIYFTQTLYFKKSPLIEMIKPRIVYLSSIDFGKITYEEEFKHLLEQENLEILEYISLKRIKHYGDQLIVTQPRQA